MEKEQFVEQLKTEINSWISNSYISKSQADTILDSYIGNGLEVGIKSNKFINMLLVNGSILLGLGVILFFASNWDYFGDLFKTVLLIGSVLMSYWAGFYLYYQKGSYKKTGYALIFLGCLLYGASIFLLGQIYNLGGSFYEAMFIWFLGVLPLAYFTRFSMIFLLGIVLFYVFVFGYFSENYHILDENSMIYLVSALSILLVSLGRFHTGDYEKFGDLLNKLGIFAIYGFVFLLTFNDFFSFDSFSSIVSYVILFILGISVSLLLFRYKGLSFNWKNEGGIFFHIFVIGTLMILNLVGVGIDSTLFYVGVNIYFFVMVIFCIYLGTLRQKDYFINVGIFFFVVFVFAKYFDWFYELFDKSLFFIFGGVLLMAGGRFLERQRKKLLSMIH